MEGRVEEAIRNYFAYQREATARKLRRLIGRGWLSLMIGLGFLALCLGAADLLLRYGTGPIFQIGNYSFIIGGWVAMSRPLEIFLYDWWPIRREQRIFDRLSRVKVQILFGAVDALTTAKSAPHADQRATSGPHTKATNPSEDSRPSHDGHRP